MKRIVNGMTYNTDTSRMLAKSSWSLHAHAQAEGRLYQTRGGAFFTITRITDEVWNERTEEPEQRVRTECDPLSRDDAHKWMMDGDVEVYDNPFDDPPEATASGDAGATIYMRVPPSLKKTVESLASNAGMSANVWAMRCLERCAEQAKKEAQGAP